MTRPEGFLVRYRTAVMFDTNAERTRYDAVALDFTCETCCKRVGRDELVEHARTHEATITAGPAAPLRPVAPPRKFPSREGKFPLTTPTAAPRKRLSPTGEKRSAQAPAPAEDERLEVVL